MEKVFHEYPKVVYKSRDEFKTVRTESEELEAEKEGFGTFREVVVGQVDHHKELKNENRALKEKLEKYESKKDPKETEEKKDPPGLSNALQNLSEKKKPGRPKTKKE